MTVARYEVRRARSDEFGRWVICLEGRSNDVRATGFFTRQGATRVARRWIRHDEKAKKTYPV